ncbi:MAG TPA: hypothetical protein VKA54_21415 [Gemmatimonadaceae bacterium]|nr:hypothetical protein [Gemmatimonadaceae bacterium]
MTRTTFVFGACLVATLSTVACQEQVTAPPLAPSAPRAATASISNPTLDDRGLGALTPPRAAVVVDFTWDAADRAINPDDYVCNPNSPLTNWLNAEIAATLAVEPNLFFAMYDRAADILPTWEALLFQTSAQPQYYGYSGQFTDEMVRLETSVKEFFDIPSEDIQVLAMHGTMLSDAGRMMRTYEALGLPHDSAYSWAATVRSSLLHSRTMRGGNWAFWTFNAVSFRTTDNSLPPKIVMGDGLLEGYAAIGYGDVAPGSIFAHEYAHQIQFERGYFDDLPDEATPPERTRYTELMADAYSAYYMTHVGGAHANPERVHDFLEVFFQIGDCAFTNQGHHGTPNQRLAAARYGFQLAYEDLQLYDGRILSTEEFHDLFVKKFPELVAPDVPVVTGHH